MTSEHRPPVAGATEAAAPRGVPPERSVVAGALAIVVLGFILRLRDFSAYWVNPDEGIYFSTLTWTAWGQFWAEVMANAHPPAFYLLLRTVGLLTEDFVWLRVTSLLAGTLAIWILWLVGRELGGRGWPGVVAGLTASALLALNVEAIALSQVLRPYMLLLTLIGGALFHLLRYRSEPTRAHLAWYVTLLCLALLVHYSAGLAFGVLLMVVAHYRVSWGHDPRSWEKLAVAQAVPATVAALLFVLHLDAARNSYMMSLALAPGGWLSEWLVASPADAWRSFVTFQTMQAPVEFQARAALLLLAAGATSVVARDTRVSVLAGGGVAIAVLASALGAYPFGPSRHNAWLLAFTLPAVGWLAGRVIAAGRVAAVTTAALVLIGVLFGTAIERTLGGYPYAGVAPEERAIRRDALAPILEEYLEPDDQPRVVLMTFQTFNLLMPLYTAERQALSGVSPPDLISFSYGSRTVVVAGQWDWGGPEHLRDVLAVLSTRLPGVVPNPPDRVLVLAGGWESTLFGAEPGPMEGDGVVDAVRVAERDAGGQLSPRLAVYVLDVARWLAGEPSL